MSRILVSVDPGKHGAISFFQDGVLDHVVDMPLIKTETKKAVTIFKHKDPKILIRSGERKGQRQTVIKTPAKHKTEIDFKAIEREIKEFQNTSWIDKSTQKDESIMVFEEQFMLLGQGHSKSIFLNLGKIIGIGMVLCREVKEVRAIVWKKHYNLIKKEKSDSIKIAKKLFDGWAFDSHDQAESALIGKYYLDMQ